MKRIIIGLVCLVSLSGLAAYRIWDGGGSDSNWSTTNNWDGAVPVAGDTLFFGGTTRLSNNNDLPAGTSFAGITFNSGAGAFQLGGNGITLAGDLINNDNSYQTINMPVNLSGTTLFSPNVSGGRMVISGEISGSGGITKAGLEYLQLTASNSYDGATFINTGTLFVNNSYALGSTNGSTTVDNNSAKLFIDGDGFDIWEELNFINAVNGYCFENRGGSNTIHSVCKVQGGRHLVNNSTLVYKGGVQAIAGSSIFIPGGNGKIIYEGKVDLGATTMYADGTTTIWLNSSNNVWGSTTLAKGTMIMNVVNALPSTSYLRFTLNYGPYGTLDLNGYDQTIKYMYTGTTNSGEKIVKSDAPAMLTLTDSGTRTFSADFKGRVGLTKGGTGTLTLNGTGSDTTGDFIINAGRLTLEAGGSLGGSSNVVANNAMIYVKTGAALSLDAAVAINGSGVLKLDEDYVVVDSLVIDSVAQVFGEWGTTASGAANVDDTHFQGSGILIVTGEGSASTSDLVWDAGAADDNFSSTNNWEGDVAPAFDGFEWLTFGSAGSSAVVDSVVGVYGMEFNRIADFTVADGAGSIELGSGGILAESTNSSSRIYTVSEDVNLVSVNQRWQVNKNGAASVILDMAGAVSSVEWCKKVKFSGDGRVYISGDNSYYGTTFIETNCVLNIYHDNALGSTNQPTTVENGGLVQLYGGINIPENITIYGDAAVNYVGAIRSNGGSNTWSGLINCPGSRIRCNSGSLDIIGGAIGTQFVLGANVGASIRVAEKPMNIVGSGFYPHSSGGPIIIAVTNNNAAQMNVNGKEIRFDVADAFNTTISWDIRNNDAEVNLNGYDQSIGVLKSRTTTIDNSKIYSDDPSTLTVNHSSNSDYRSGISGQVSLVKQGTARLTLHAQLSTSGSVTVVEGTLAMANTASFVNVPEFSITGGILLLEGDECLNDASRLTLETGGVVTVNSGLVEEVGWLTIDGERKRIGTYGATGSGAQHIDDTFFSGSGQIKVLHDLGGTVIIVR